MINIDNIQLSVANPRLTPIKNLDVNLIQIMIEKNKKYDEEEVIKELMRNEGDFSNLLNLVDSIKLSGFVTDGDKPVFIKQANGKYITAEGNRRMMTLKLIHNNALLNLLSEKIKVSKDEIDPNYDSDDDVENSRSKDNIKKIKSKIQLISINNEWFDESKYDFVEDDINGEEKIWSLIYTKHIAGERPGIRRWSRSKYFLDILNFFKNGIDNSEETRKKVLIKIKRNFETIILDYKYAQFVRDFFWFNFYDKENPEKWKTSMLNSAVSGLQQNFSLSRIKRHAKKAFSPNKINFDEYFKISFDNEHKIIYSGKIKPKSLFAFMDIWRNKGFMKTREPRDSDEITNFQNEIHVLLKNGVSNIDQITYEQFQDLDIWKLSEKQLTKIWKSSNNNKIVRPVKKVLEVNLAINTLISEAKKSILNKASYVFDILIQQLEHNSNKVKYYNAIAVSIRSLIEQILIWGICDYTKGLSIISPVNNVRKSWLERLSRPSDDKNAKAMVHQMLAQIRGNKGIMTYDHIKKIISNITIFKDEEARSKAKFFVDHIQELNDINEFIHALHRARYSDKYFSSIQKLINWQENLLDIYKNLNKEYIEKIQGEIEAINKSIENHAR